MPCHCRSRHVGEAAVGAARCRGARAKTIAFKGNAQAELDTATVTDATKSSGPLSLVIGAETWGAKDRYVGLDKRVFPVDDQTLKPLQYAKTRLVERNLQPLAEADVEKIDVSANGASVSNTVFVFAPSAEASALTWAAWRPFLDEGSASVPDAYLQYPEGEPGVSIDPDRPTVVIIDAILAPGVNLAYRGTSDGEEGIFPVFQAWLTPR